MNLKNIFKTEEELRREEPEKGPRVIFEDVKLQIAVGQWLRLLPELLPGTDDYYFNYYCDSSAEDILKEINISKDLLEQIAENFGYLLEKTGVSKIETCK